MGAAAQACPLCEADGGALIWRGEKLCVIRADEAGFPAFYRVVWNAHVAEFSDLSAADRAHCMEVVVQVEQALRAHLQPTKINLATLGNMVAHLHWHIIPRWKNDPHFPQAIWAALPESTPDGQEAQRARRAGTMASLPRFHQTLPNALTHAMA